MVLIEVAKAAMRGLNKPNLCRRIRMTRQSRSQPRPGLIKKRRACSNPGPNSMPTVSPPGSVISTLPSDPSLRLPARTLGQADFLKLLATQMSAQDPLKPQSDTNFIAQMAQFSSLQANTGMQQALAQMQATGLLGRTVSLQIDSATAP